MFKNSAPGDEYFGRMKLSYLGMNNTFRDSAISSGEHTTDAALAHKVADAEDALDAWAKKYPRDPQLARTYFLATNAERKIWIQANQGRAWKYLNQLAHGFADTYFGKIAKKGLAVGFTEHYYAPAVACETPAPGPEATGDVPAPVLTPAPPLSPQPAVTTLAPGHKVEVLPQACIPPPSPSPSPSPTTVPIASPSPSPDESAAPLPAGSPNAS